MKSIFLLPFKALSVITFIFIYSANAGYRNVTHSFEVISQSISEELEDSYDMFIFINTEEGPTQLRAFIPNQHMLVVKKNPNSKKVFLRNDQGVITGLVSGTQQLSDLIPSNVLSDPSPPAFGFPFDWDGLQVLPISTGTLYHMPTFSGVFQINWSRSQTMYTGDETQPMSHSLYVGYYYHDSSKPSDQWTEDTREQVSYVAVHGTPKPNWASLGRSRASHGCARVRAPIMNAIYDVVDNLPLKNVIELDWDHELPRINKSPSLKKQKPVLFLIFNGY